jgi:hypothetical protein
MNTRANDCQMRRLALLSSFAFTPLVAAVLTLPGCSNSRTSPAESPRLHVVSVLYGRYVAAHEGEMPASREELVNFIDESERDILQRRGYKSAEELFDESASHQRLIVLYRDQRDRLQTEFVAIEERSHDEKTPEGIVRRSKWFAADTLGAAQAIDEQQAKRVLAEAG